MGSFHTRRTLAAAGVAVLALFAVQGALAFVPDPRLQPVNKLTAADNARANASIVRLSDLVPGFEPAKPGRTPHVPHCSTYPGDRSDITTTGFASAGFEIRNAAGRLTANSIGSSAQFYKTAADAERYWQKTVRLAYIKCLAALLQFDGGIKPTKVFSATQIKIGPTGAEKASAFRLIANVSLRGRKPFTYTETVAFVKVARSIATIRIVYANHLCECHTDIAGDLVRRLTIANRQR